MTQGRIWWPVATLALMLFPGFGGAINLGQNAVFSLGLLLVGWWQLRQGREAVAGVVWGLLAYKPVWAAAFLLFPLLTRRWRMAGAMVLTGVILGLLTLPIVGVQTWFDWLAIGRVATHGYEEFVNWVQLSRDLSCLPLRWLVPRSADGLYLDQQHPVFGPARMIGRALWLGVVLTTVVLALWRRDRVRSLEGPAPSFVLLGAYFSCFHFVYYDAMLAALPIVVLCHDPARFARLPRSWEELPRWLWDVLPLLALGTAIALRYLGEALLQYADIPPFDTYALLLIWAWCGWQGLGSGKVTGAASATGGSPGRFAPHPPPAG
jgi:hypothetical protein